MSGKRSSRMGQHGEMAEVNINPYLRQIMVIRRLKGIKLVCAYLGGSITTDKAVIKEDTNLIDRCPTLAILARCHL
ncbi:Uncharacterised protein [Chlamydia trachomatis]|nr:Uncharacterised protein [Chlamydia trachomatis]